MIGIDPLNNLTNFQISDSGHVAVESKATNQVTTDTPPFRTVSSESQQFARRFSYGNIRRLIVVPVSMQERRGG